MDKIQTNQSNDHPQPTLGSARLGSVAHRIMCLVWLAQRKMQCNVIRSVLSFQVDALWREVKEIKSYLQCSVRRGQKYDKNNPAFLGCSGSVCVCVCLCVWVCLCLFDCVYMYSCLYELTDTSKNMIISTEPFMSAQSTWSLKTCHITTAGSANIRRHNRVVCSVGHEVKEVNTFGNFFQIFTSCFGPQHN